MKGFIKPVEHWRPLVVATLNVYWPSLEPEWVLSMIEQESLGNVAAVSRVGAQGLMQLMPATGREVGVTDPFDPNQNIRGGIQYLHRQYRNLSHVWYVTDRLFWSMAAYNGGLGYVRKALQLARFEQTHGQDADSGSWDGNKHYLQHPSCTVTIDGRVRRPDSAQIIGYVDTIRERHRRATSDA